MSLSHSSPTRSNRASGVVIALIASLLVLVSPVTQSNADYISLDTRAIIYNDQVCNLGDPADHLTGATAFEISTSEQLWEITDCVSNSATIYFELGDDIDVSDITRAGNAPTSSPIGYSASGDLSFSGVIDGKNKLISGIAMNSANYGVGLFAYLHDATVRNLFISGSFTTSSNFYGNGHSAGSLAIKAAGQLYLSSISNQASVAGFYFVGGLVGEVSGSANIVASFNSAPITGQFYSGGLIGVAKSNIYVSHSSNTGAVTGRSQLGGLIGAANDTATIYASYNTGAVASSTNQNVFGGLVGYAEIANIDYSYNTGTVSGRNFVGGLVGLVNQNARITSSFNTGRASGDNGIAGLLGKVVGDAYINSSYQAGEVNWITGFDGLVGTVSGAVTTTTAYSSVASLYVATTPVADMKLASTFVGFDNAVWDFESPNDNQGFPILRVVAQLSANSALVSLVLSQGTLAPGFATGTTAYTASVPNVITSVTLTPTRADAGATVTVQGVSVSSGNTSGTISLAVGSNVLRIVVTAADSTTTTYTVTITRSAAEQKPELAPDQTPAYAGPVISGAPSAVAGTEVTLTGNRLETVTTAHVGGVQIKIVSALAQSLTLDVPSSMVPGNYDLVLQSSFGTLTIQKGLTVLAPLETGSVVEATTKKLTVVALKGFIAIYTKGYEGQKLSAKVAGKWLVVDPLKESWRQNNYSRTVRFIGAGYDIFVHLYVDGEFIKTEMLTTK